MRSRERAESVIVIFSPSSVPSVMDIIGFFFLIYLVVELMVGEEVFVMRRGSSCRLCSLM
jgi:hypothetical protein